jgi:hypothetical protein
MPKQVQKDTTAVHEKAWLSQQPAFTSPTEGASQDASDSTIDLKHNESLGLHKGGKSVAPDAISDFARPLARRTSTTSGREVASTKGTEAGHQRDYDPAGPDEQPKIIKRDDREKR